MLSALLFFTVASSSTDLTHIQEFCQLQGLGECFAVTNIHADHETITMDNRDPISISHAQMMPITLLGEVGWELEFQTTWGSGVLIQMPNEVSFTGEIPLEGDIVLHIFPCPDSEECTSFGYELQEEPLDEEEEEESEEEEMEAGGRRRAALNSERGAFISRVHSLPKSNGVGFISRQKAHSALPRRTAHVNALRRSLDSTSTDCEQVVDANADFSWADGFTTTYHWTTVCTITVRMVFPEPDYVLTMVDINAYVRVFLEATAALIVGEFNEAMSNSIDSGDEIFQMKLEHVDFMTYDESLDPMDVCWDYRQQNDDSDLTHCIIPDTMGSVSVFGQARFPRSAKAGTSWVKTKTLPGYSKSGRHDSVHEFGHNLDARHVYNGAQWPSVMIPGSEPGSNNRLLEFASNAQDYHSNTVEYINNVDTVRQNFPTFANLK